MTKQRRPPLLLLILSLVVSVALAVDRDSPTRQFKGSHTSPVLILTGLRDMPTDYVVARINDRKPASLVRETGLPSVSSIKPKIHELRSLFIRADRSEGVRAVAIPEFRLNRTSTLRLAIWYPCEDPPEDVGILAMPCFFEPLDPSQYGPGHFLPRVERGRRTTLYIRHHDPPGGTEVDDSDPDSPVEYISGLNDRGEPILEPLADYAGPTTRATCWLPPARALDLDTMPLEVTEHSYRLQVNHLYYQNQHSHSAAVAAEESEEPLPIDAFGNPHPGLDPDVWYGMELIQHLPPDLDAAPVRNRPYCRSWVLVSLAHGKAGGWTVLPPNARVGSAAGKRRSDPRAF